MGVVAVAPTPDQVNIGELSGLRGIVSRHPSGGLQINNYNVTLVHMVDGSTIASLGDTILNQDNSSKKFEFNAPVGSNAGANIIGNDKVDRTSISQVVGNDAIERQRSEVLQHLQAVADQAKDQVLSETDDRAIAEFLHGFGGAVEKQQYDQAKGLFQRLWTPAWEAARGYASLKALMGDVQNGANLLFELFKN